MELKMQKSYVKGMLCTMMKPGITARIKAIVLIIAVMLCQIYPSYALAADGGPVGTPYVTNPSNNASLDKADMNICWQPVANTYCYFYTLKDTSNGSYIYQEYSTNNTSFQLAAAN